MKIWLLVGLLIVSFGVYLEGCVPALIVAQASGDDDKAERHRKFKEHFDDVNIQRESKGLEPLDWCTEVWEFDPQWAKDLKCPDNKEQ